ncbi:aldehyde dehydrogenase family protein [Streptomyces sp. FXJ1.172]|uniref:aldehyde dehydrogenase family protein n=1 Tax=Streptomyces sp. FXJ1.172 TaxID=710705 RepID=UPI000D183A8E|nr:aldehyde dehydrogenase family protein [Streptomyces sp. FXJ1.172]WEO99554.1 aldehyde dehydrogenase family protein [Streptomyces sp. FXJ1.172]
MPRDNCTAKFATRVTQLNCGDPADSATAVGPVVNSRAERRITALVEDARARGATLGSLPDLSRAPATGDDFRARGRRGPGGRRAGGPAASGTCAPPR